MEIFTNPLSKRSLLSKLFTLFFAMNFIFSTLSYFTTIGIIPFDIIYTIILLSSFFCIMYVLIKIYNLSQLQIQPALNYLSFAFSFLIIITFLLYINIQTTTRISITLSLVSAIAMILSILYDKKRQIFS